MKVRLSGYNSHKLFGAIAKQAAYIAETFSWVISSCPALRFYGYMYLYHVWWSAIISNHMMRLQMSVARTSTINTAEPRCLSCLPVYSMHYGLVCCESWNDGMHTCIDLDLVYIPSRNKMKILTNSPDAGLRTAVLARPRGPRRHWHDWLVSMHVPRGMCYQNR